MLLSYFTRSFENEKSQPLYFKRLAMYIYEKRQMDFSISICLILLIFNCTRVQIYSQRENDSFTSMELVC